MSCRWLALSVVAAALFGAGCGGGDPPRKTAKVSGTVKYKSAPVTRGTIVFQPSSGAPAFARIGENGSYTLEAVVGKNTITVESRKDPPAPTGPSPTAAPVRGESLIPEKYSQPNSSGLSRDVESQEMNTIDFDLTD